MSEKRQRNRFVWPILYRGLVLVLMMLASLAVPQSAAVLSSPISGADVTTISTNPAPDAAEPTEQALPVGVATNWWATAQENICRSEYDVTWQDHTCLPDVSAAYQAPNRAQNLRIYFTPTGIRVIPRTATAPDWEWGLILTGYGYEGNTHPVADAELSADANRIKYRRGDLTEWYVNDERGLEQGFTIQSPPLLSSSAPVLLNLALTGDLTPHLTDDYQAVEFTTASGERVLRYSDLHATDATGRFLSARFSIGNRQSVIRILVDDTDAVYPITIAPTITGLSTTADWTAESNQASASFGRSVGMAGDVNGDGYADAIVGAPDYDNGETSEGRAFVYYGSASGLSTTADWTAESDQAFTNFGFSVGTAGDINGDGYADVIVGAPFYTNGEASEGRAFVYHGSAFGLSTIADWTAESDQARATFGWSVGTAGDINGAGYADVIVGARQYDNGQTDEGRAYVYYGSASGLSTTADWTAESDQASANFGISVGTAGDVNGDDYADVIVGAYQYDNGQTGEGRAYVYHGSSTGLTTASADWVAESNQVSAWFGHSVGTAGDVNGDGYADAIVGAPHYDNLEANEGRAYVYHGSASGLSTSANWTAESNQAFADFGFSVGTAGDVNGDGYADVIVGAYQYDNGQTDEGRAYVYHGSSTGLTTGSVDWTAESNQSSASFGISVGTAGDVNGDGYADVIVGAHRYDNGATNEGRAYVYHDMIPPVSTVTELPTCQSTLSFPVSWSGSDATSGIASYDIQSRDGAGVSWEDWQVNTIATSTAFAGEDGHTYYFQSRATDNAGNIESYPGSDGDTHTTVDVTPPSSSITNLSQIWASSSARMSALSSSTVQVAVEWEGNDDVSGVKWYDVQYKQGSAGTWTDWLTGTTQTSATFNATSGYTYYFQSRAEDNAGNWEDYPGGDGDAHLCVLYGDFDPNGRVDVADIMLVAAKWRTTADDPEWEARYDLDGDGIITVVDIMKVAAHWGETCE